MKKIKNVNAILGVIAHFLLSYLTKLTTHSNSHSQLCGKKGFALFLFYVFLGELASVQWGDRMIKEGANNVKSECDFNTN